MPAHRGGDYFTRDARSKQAARAVRQAAIQARLDFAYQRRRARHGAAHASASGQHTPSLLQGEGRGAGRNVGILQLYPHPVLPPARRKGLNQRLIQRRHVRGDLGEVVAMVGFAQVCRRIIER